MKRTLARRGIAWLASLAMSAAFIATLLPASPASASVGAGAVYTETNVRGANAIVVFKRAADGTLTQAATVLTGGGGTSSALGSQGAVIISSDGSRLFAVNAGTNQISSFSLSADGLTVKLLDVQPSGGVTPVSLTMKGTSLYALNAMGIGNVTGFRVGADGTLAPIPNSTRRLSGPLVQPAEVRFNPAGTVLMVTERGTQRIDTYPIDGNGIPGARIVTRSPGLEPFGFAFDPAGHPVVSETFGGLPGKGAASSYTLAGGGRLQVVSATVPNGQTATCWVSVTDDGYAFMTNTGSGTVTSYRVGSSGSLSLLEAVAGNISPTSAPIDLDLDRASHLFVLASGLGTIHGFAVGSAGGLSKINAAGSLPPSAGGLAAR